MSELISFNNYLKPVGNLPKHITKQQYLQLRELPKQIYANKELVTKKNAFMIARDQLLIDTMWETGGRIADITNLRKQHFDFREKILNLHIQKTRMDIKISLSDELAYSVMNFYTQFPSKEPFEMTRQNAWTRMKMYGKHLKMQLHPHMFRHGLALFLIYSGVSLAVVSYRLGHKDVRTTMKYYLVMTPEIERKALQGVEFR